jgi:glycosyltransferase involved in cell wall biosynthesis
MKKPLVSILMSVYNENLEFLKVSIESIINQSYKNIEFIIINDSPDNLVVSKILEEYKHEYENISIVENQCNIGLAKSLNQAIKISNGKYIARMDSDDISINDRLEKQLEFLTKNNYDLIGSYIEKIDMNNHSLGVSIVPTSNKQIDRLLPYATVAFHPTWFGKKEVFENIMYNDLFITAQDYEFISRAMSKGYNIGNINEVLLRYRVNSNALSSKKAYVQLKLHQFVAIKQKNNLYDLNSEIERFLSNIDKIKQYDYIRTNDDFVRLAKDKTIINTFKVLKNVLLSKDFRYRFKNFIMSKMILKYV